MFLYYAATRFNIFSYDFSAERNYSGMPDNPIQENSDISCSTSDID